MAVPKIKRDEDGGRVRSAKWYQRTGLGGLAVGALSLIPILLYWRRVAYVVRPWMLWCGGIGLTIGLVCGVVALIGYLVRRSETRKENQEWDEFMQASPEYQNQMKNWNKLSKRIDSWADLLQGMVTPGQAQFMLKKCREELNAEFKANNMKEYIGEEPSQREAWDIVNVMKARLKDMLKQEKEDLESMKKAFEAWKAAKKPPKWPPAGPGTQMVIGGPPKADLIARQMAPFQQPIVQHKNGSGTPNNQNQRFGPSGY